jgi:hypothetical protein
MPEAKADVPAYFSWHSYSLARERGGEFATLICHFGELAKFRKISYDIMLRIEMGEFANSPGYREPPLAFVFYRVVIDAREKLR